MHTHTRKIMKIIQESINQKIDYILSQRIVKTIIDPNSFGDIRL